MVEHKCDFCKVGGFNKGTMSLLTLTMSENYPKHNSAKGTFGSPCEWELCPVCFEHITEAIKQNIKSV